MKEVTLKIPESKFNFFMELVNELGIETADQQDADFEIPEWQKEIVLERLKKNKEEDLIPWEETKKQFKFNT